MLQGGGEQQQGNLFYLVWIVSSLSMCSCHGSQLYGQFWLPWAWAQVSLGSAHRPIGSRGLDTALHILWCVLWTPSSPPPLEPGLVRICSRPTGWSTSCLFSRSPYPPLIYPTGPHDPQASVSHQELEWSDWPHLVQANQHPHTLIYPAGPHDPQACVTSHQELDLSDLPHPVQSNQHPHKQIYLVGPHDPMQVSPHIRNWNGVTCTSGTGKPASPPSDISGRSCCPATKIMTGVTWRELTWGLRQRQNTESSS